MNQPGVEDNRFPASREGSAVRPGPGVFDNAFNRDYFLEYERNAPLTVVMFEA